MSSNPLWVVCRRYNKSVIGQKRKFDALIATSALYYERNWCDVYSLHERHIRRYLPMETTTCMILGTDFSNHPNFSDARSKGKDMSNNIDFITSIKDELAFEEVVRQVAKYIYDAEAYLSGGLLRRWS